MVVSSMASRTFTFEISSAICSLNEIFVSIENRLTNNYSFDDFWYSFGYYIDWLDGVVTDCPGEDIRNDDELLEMIQSVERLVQRERNLIEHHLS